MGRVPTGASQLGQLYAVAADPSNEHGFAVAGSGRSVGYLDTRKWRFVNCWPNLTKYEITSLHISTRPRQVFVVGALDSQLAAFALNPSVSAKRSFDASKGFLADSRWTGIRLFSPPHADHDAVAGCTQSGQLYFASDVMSLVQSSDKRELRPQHPSAASKRSRDL